MNIEDIFRTILEDHNLELYDFLYGLRCIKHCTSERLLNFYVIFNNDTIELFPYGIHKPGEKFDLKNPNSISHIYELLRQNQHRLDAVNNLSRFGKPEPLTSKLQSYFDNLDILYFMVNKRNIYRR